MSESFEPGPVTDPREIERVASGMGISPDKIASLEKYRRPNGILLDDITLAPDVPIQAPTLTSRLRRFLVQRP